jgi:hypothetical protein
MDINKEKKGWTWLGGEKGTLGDRIRPNPWRTQITRQREFTLLRAGLNFSRNST